MERKREKKCFKWLLYSSTILLAMSTPVNVIAVTKSQAEQANQNERQARANNYEAALDAYNAARTEYQTAKDAYSSRQTEYNDLVLAAENAKSNYDQKVVELENAKATYNNLKLDYETAKATYDSLMQQFNETNDAYTAATPAYETSKATYEALVGPYETAKTALIQAENDYNDQLVIYNNLKSQVEVDGRLEQAYLTAKSTYDTELADYKIAKAKYEKDQLNYQTAVAQYNSLLRTYQTNQGNYQTQLDAYNAKKAIYEDTLTEYNTALDELTVLNAEVDALTIKYQESLAEYTPIQDQYHDLLAEYEAIKTEYNNKKDSYLSELAALNDLIAEHNTEIAAYNQMKEELTTAKQEYEQAVTSYHSITESLNNLLPVYEAKVTEYEQAKVAYQTEVTAYQTAKAAYDQSKTNYTNQLTLLQGRIDTYAANRDAAQKVLNQYAEGTAEYAAAYQAYTENKTLYEQTQAEYQTVKTAYDKLLADFAPTQQNFETVTANFNALEAQYQSLKNEYDSLSAQKVQAEQSYQDLEIKYTTASDQYIQIKAEHERLLGEITALTAERDRVSTLHDDLATAYADAQTRLAAGQANYEIVKEYYQQTLTDYRNAMAKYETAQIKADGLKVDKEALEISLAELNISYTQLETELGVLNEELATVQAEKITLRTIFETTKTTFETVSAQFEEVTRLLGIAETARQVVIDQVAVAGVEFQKIKIQYDALVSQNSRLKNQFDAAMVEYNKANELYTNLAAQKTTLDGLIVDIQAEITDKDLVGKYNTAKAEYDNIQNVVLPEAKTAYDEVKAKIDALNNSDVKRDYDAALAKYQEMLTTFGIAEPLVNDFNENILNVEEYVAAQNAQEAAATAKAELEAAYGDISSLMADYPVDVDTAIGGIYNEGTFDSTLFENIQTWENSNKTAIADAITEAVQKLTEYKEAMDAYQTAYEAYQGLDIFPSDGVDFIEFTDQEYALKQADLVDMQETIQQNAINADTFIEIIKMYNQLLENYENQYIKALGFEVTKEIDSSTGEVSYILSEGLAIREQMDNWYVYWQMFNVSGPAAMYDTVQWQALIGLDDELRIGNIQTQDEFEDLINFYENYGLELIKNQIVPYADQSEGTINNWINIRESFITDVTNKIEETGAKDIKFDVNRIRTEGNMANTMNDFKQSTDIIAYIPGLGPTSSNMYANTVYGNADKLRQFSINWESVVDGSFPLQEQIDSGFLGQQNSVIFSPNRIPVLNFSPNVTFKKAEIDLDINVIDVPEPTTIEIDPVADGLNPWPTYDIAPPTIDIVEVEPIVTNLVVETVEPVTLIELHSISAAAPTEVVVNLPGLETTENVTEVKFEVSDPTENTRPVRPTDVINEVVDPVKPTPEFDESPAFEDIQPADPFDPTPIETPEAPGDEIVREEEEEIIITEPISPVPEEVVEPVEPELVPEIDPPVIEPAAPTPVDPEDPIDPPNGNSVLPSTGRGTASNIASASGYVIRRTNTGNARISPNGGQLPNTGNRLPQTSELNPSWYQQLGAGFIGVLGILGIGRRRKQNAEEKAKSKK